VEFSDVISNSSLPYAVKISIKDNNPSEMVSVMSREV
jgi:hypothetical protein